VELAALDAFNHDIFTQSAAAAAAAENVPNGGNRSAALENIGTGGAGNAGFAAKKGASGTRGSPGSNSGDGDGGLTHLGACSRCLLCPWHGYRQRGRTKSATATERSLGFGNCTGTAGRFAPPCQPGDVAVAACLAALGVVPVEVPGLLGAFSHLNKERKHPKQFFERIMAFANSDSPPSSPRPQQQQAGQAPVTNSSAPPAVVAP